MTPEFKRSDRHFSDTPVPVTFSKMDLPWYGGKVEMATESSMTVAYVPSMATPDQLKDWWPQALEDAGWTIEHSSVSGNGTLDAIIVRPDGRRGLMTIRPEGSLWWLILTVDP